MNPTDVNNLKLKCLPFKRIYFIGVNNQGSSVSPSTNKVRIVPFHVLKDFYLLLQNSGKGRFADSFDITDS